MYADQGSAASSSTSGMGGAGVNNGGGMAGGLGGPGYQSSLDAFNRANDAGGQSAPPPQLPQSNQPQRSMDPGGASVPGQFQTNGQDNGQGGRLQPSWFDLPGAGAGAGHGGSVDGAGDPQGQQFQHQQQPRGGQQNQPASGGAGGQLDANTIALGEAAGIPINVITELAQRVGADQARQMVEQAAAPLAAQFQQAAQQAAMAQQYGFAPPSPQQQPYQGQFQQGPYNGFQQPQQGGFAGGGQQQQQQPRAMPGLPSRADVLAALSPLADDDGQADAVAKAIFDPMSTALSTLSTHNERLQQQVGQIVQFMQQQQLQQVNNDIEQFYGGLGEQYKGIYGSGRSLTPSQQMARHQVDQHAALLVQGARAMGRNLSVQQALTMAHQSSSSQHQQQLVMQQARQQAERRRGGMGFSPAGPAGSSPMAHTASGHGQGQPKSFDDFYGEWERNVGLRQ